MKPGRGIGPGSLGVRWMNIPARRGLSGRASSRPERSVTSVLDTRHQQWCRDDPAKADQRLPTGGLVFQRPRGVEPSPPETCQHFSDKRGGQPVSSKRYTTTHRPGEARHPAPPPHPRHGPTARGAKGNWAQTHLHIGEGRWGGQAEPLRRQEGAARADPQGAPITIGRCRPLRHGAYSRRATSPSRGDGEETGGAPHRSPSLRGRGQQKRPVLPPAFFMSVGSIRPPGP